MRAGGLGANYWKLLSANVLGNLGDGVAVVALPWYASTLTHDPLAIASVGVAGPLPWLLVTLLAGVIGVLRQHRADDDPVGGDPEPAGTGNGTMWGAELVTNQFLGPRWAGFSSPSRWRCRSPGRR